MVVLVPTGVVTATMVHFEVVVSVTRIEKNI